MTLVTWPKDQIILPTGRGILADFWVPHDIESWNFQNLIVFGIVKPLKIWYCLCFDNFFFIVSKGEPKEKCSRFWKLQLSMFCGTQKCAKAPLPIGKMIRFFFDSRLCIDVIAIKHQFDAEWQWSLKFLKRNNCLKDNVT